MEGAGIEVGSMDANIANIVMIFDFRLPGTLAPAVRWVFLGIGALPCKYNIHALYKHNSS